MLVLEKEKGAVITSVEKTGPCVSLQGSRAEYNLNLNATPDETYFFTFPLPVVSKIAPLWYFQSGNINRSTTIREPNGIVKLWSQASRRYCHRT